jgi:molybdopterin/thiamine biosynthesis adenylyltransferase
MTQHQIPQEPSDDSFQPISLAPGDVAKYRAVASITVRDVYLDIIEELFRIDNPSVSPLDHGAYAARLSEYKEAYLGGISVEDHGAWFYYPWQHTVVHVPAEAGYYRLKTARNRNLITTDEQQKLKTLSIGIAGLSVGSSAAAALAHIGIRHFKLADADTLALSNLNRLRGGVHNLGVAKTVIAARNIYELDPYSKVELFTEGVSQASLAQFVANLDIAIDEMDDVTMKTQLRLLAKQHQIPVLMATDNGDNVLIDIERYDEDSSLPIFHGLLSEKDVQTILSGGLSPQDFMHYALKIIEVRHAPTRLLSSVPLIGRELAGIPQLGSAAMLAGAVVAYVVREIACGASLKHGKHHVNLEALLRADYPALEAMQQQLLQRKSG